MDCLFNLRVRSPSPLRTCEVTDRSGLTVIGQHQGSMHQFFRLSIQCTVLVRMLVIGLEVLMLLEAILRQLRQRHPSPGSYFQSSDPLSSGKVAFFGT